MNHLPLKKEHSNNKSLPFSLLAFYCITRLCFVCTTSMSYFNLILVFTVGMVCIFFSWLSSPKFGYDFLQSNILFLAIYTVIIFFLKLLIKNTSFLDWPNKYIKQLLVLIVIWGLYVYMKNSSAKIRKRIMIWYLIGIAISAIYTFYVAITSTQEDVIRQTAFGEFDSSFRFTYGGFDFIYGLVIVYVCLLTATHQVWKRIRNLTRLLFILLMVISALTVIISGYSTAFALILVFTILELMPRGISKYVLLVFLAICIFVFPVAITKFIDAIPFIPDLTSERINNIILSLSGRNTIGYLSDSGQRLDRIKWSLRIFAEHPFFGGLVANTELPFGYHTEWIEQLARYGLIPAIPFWAFFVQTVKTMLRNSKDVVSNYKTVRNAFVIFFILGFLDPISFVITAAPIFILAPFISDTFLIKSNETDKR